MTVAESRWADGRCAPQRWDLKERREFQRVEMNGENIGQFPIDTPICDRRNTRNTDLRAARLAGILEELGEGLVAFPRVFWELPN